MVPSEHQGIEALLRETVTPCGMRGCGWFKRGEDIVKMGSNGLQKLPSHGILDRCDQAEKERQCCADASDRAEPTAGGTQGSGVAEQMAQAIELIVACHGVLTRMMGACIVVETLVQIGRTCGVVACLCGLVFLGNGRRGGALQWTAPVKEVLKRVQPIPHPPRVLARRVRARHEAPATIGGHTEALEAVRAEVGTMGFPGLGRALRGQLNVQDGRTVCLNRDPDGLMAGKNLIAQIHHHCVLWQREGRRQRSTVVLAAFTAIPHGVGLVVAVLEERGETRQRAFAFHTSQQDAWVQQG